MNYYLGIDLGTSGVKCMLMRGDGDVVGTSYQGYDIIKARADFAEQDIDVLWAKTVKCIADLVKRFPVETAQLQGMSFSGQMHGLVMVGEDKTPIRNTIIWADQRSAQEIDRIYSVIGKDDYRSVIKNSLSTGFLVSSLVWVKVHEPDVYEKAAKVMFPKDYIRYRLCGEIATDMTDASGGAIFDTERRCWAWDFIDRLGLKRDIFPPCFESNAIVGTLTAQSAALLGLKEGIKVVCGGGDTMMVGVGNSIITPGILASNIGTSCQISGAFDSPVYDKQFRTNTFCHVESDKWLLMGAHLNGGVTLKWLKNQILGMDSYDHMTALAENVPAGSEGLLFLPYLSGERTPYNDPNAKGIYLGLTLKHTNAHLIRATMEGIVFGIRSSMDIFKELGVSYHRIVASGGAANSRLWLQIQADIFDCEIFVNQSKEQGCTGAAITAAVACGEYTSYKEACEHIVHFADRAIQPNPANRKLYDGRYRAWKELYPHNRDLFVK